MEKLLISNGYLPQFNDSVTHCRKIYDHLVIFDREGVISGVRTNNPRLKDAKNFYAFMQETEATRITQECASFDIKWIIVDTDFGPAAIYTALYGICRLLFAVIFIAAKEQVHSYFANSPLNSIFLSPEAQAFPLAKADTAERSLIDETFKSAVRAFSCNGISEIKYSLGTRVGKFLAEQILYIADFAGCAGDCASLLDIIPRLDNFSPEIFVTVSLCTALFARENSLKRRFDAKLSEYKEHILISFCIELNEDFILYANRKFYNKLIFECEKAANAHDAYFDCSLLDGDTPRLILSCVPESDPIPNRRIKQDIRSHIRSFWE